MRKKINAEREYVKDTLTLQLLTTGMKLDE